MTSTAVEESRTPAADAPIQWKIDGAVGVVTMTKPPHNLLDDVLLEALVTAYREAVEAGARAILLRSALRHFCAGAEVETFGATTVTHTDPVKFAALLEGLENIRVPTIAALNGGVLGGGLEIALTCDMILAADSAFLGQVEVAVGLHPLLGGTQRLVQRAGVARAKEIAMLGRRHSPQAFERWGVINLVVPEEELGAVSLTWARQLAAGPTRILWGIKMLANESARAGITAADRRQVEINEMIWATEDRKRGIEAFLKTGPGTAVYQGN
jgi:enoyl-CoA hydratase/carnithine racemase